MKWLRLAFMLFAVGLTLVTYSQLPEIMPTHWNIKGEIDGWMPKQYAAWLMPVIALIMWGLFVWAPKMDPKKEKYQEFAKEWEIIQTGIMGFFTYLHAVTIYVTLNPRLSLMPFMFGGLGILFVIIGNYMSKLRQNFFIGIKIPWTLTDEENWNKTHRFASWWFVGLGLALFAEALRQAQGKLPGEAPVIIFGGMMLVIIMPMLYSFLLYKKAEHLMKYVYVGVVLIIAGIALVRG